MVGKIITANVFPPIPDRRFDWCAYHEEHAEVSHRYGWGSTEAEAVADVRRRDEEYAEPDLPQQWYDCETCGGEGTVPFRVTVYEHGCGFPHDDTDERTCDACGGRGGRLDDVEADEGRAVVLEVPHPRGE